MTDEIIPNTSQPIPAKLVIIQGIVQNLPEVVEALKEIYALRKEGEKFSQVLQSRLDELNINKENFKVLVENLTELSKAESADDETKAMYKDMVKTLFDLFVNNMQKAQDLSNYVKGL